MIDLLKLTGYIVYGIYVVTSLWLFFNGLVQLHLLWHYKKKRFKKEVVLALPTKLPFVSIQVPVYNEKYVIQRLLKALAKLDYPNDRYEIQVLDDSSDETSFIIEEEVKALAQHGIRVQVLKRHDRSGFKAGALEAGLPLCKGELIAIFDADFIPDVSFLKSLVPYFSNPAIGLVQARWGHINEEQNYLTRLQTFLLDTHFSIEQTGRFQAGYFINFCGTAGIWRKQCIVEAGGWDGSVLSEDLDLSYRAQLKGWKLIYDQTTEVPAELPSIIEAFKTQQFRWTKGMAQISKKLLRTVIKTSLPTGKKIHGVFHLLGSFVFVCLLINALLTVPLLFFRNQYPEFINLTKYTLFTSLNLAALTLFYYNGTRQKASNNVPHFWRHYPLFLVVYMGMSVQNTIAVLQGFFGAPSPFIRTPKFNTAAISESGYFQNKFSLINGVETAVLLYFFSGIGLSFYFKDYFMLLFFSMFCYGLGFLLYHSFMPLKNKNIAVGI